MAATMGNGSGSDVDEGPPTNENIVRKPYTGRVNLGPIFEALLGIPETDADQWTILHRPVLDKMLRELVESNEFVVPEGHRGKWIMWFDGSRLPITRRMIQSRDLEGRLRALLEYTLPWGPEQGVPPKIHIDEHGAFMGQCNVRTGALWANITELAAAGLLDQYKPDDMRGLLAGIREHLHGGQQPYFNEWTPIRRASAVPVEAAAKASVLGEAVAVEAPAVRKFAAINAPVVAKKNAASGARCWQAGCQKGQLPNDEAQDCRDGRGPG